MSGICPIVSTYLYSRCPAATISNMWYLYQQIGPFHKNTFCGFWSFTTRTKTRKSAYYWTICKHWTPLSGYKALTSNTQRKCSQCHQPGHTKQTPSKQTL